MKRYISIIMLSLGCYGSTAQQRVINTDSPDQSDGTHIVEAHHFQVETGLQFSQLDEATHEMDNVTLLRYGFSKKFEARLLNQYSVIHDEERTEGFQPLTISFKNLICKQRGLLPKITLVSYFHLPFAISAAFFLLLEILLRYLVFRKFP